MYLVASAVLCVLAVASLLVTVWALVYVENQRTSLERRDCLFERADRRVDAQIIGQAHLRVTLPPIHDTCR